MTLTLLLALTALALSICSVGMSIRTIRIYGPNMERNLQRRVARQARHAERARRRS